jgi:SAM-dependent methyltransferase
MAAVKAGRAALRAPGEHVPPRDMCRLVGSGSRIAHVHIGRASLQLLRRHGELKPTDRVLEPGCGCGRIAAPLAQYLEDGSYEGFDIVPELTEWASAHITRRHPNFRFRHVDLKNAMYNPSKGGNASAFTFPYDDASFDFAVTSSLFTHMLWDDTSRYLSEIARTLKPGGTAVMSFFILNDEITPLPASSDLKFPHRVEHDLRVEVPDKPCDAVAYPEAQVRALLRQHGFILKELLFGSWCGRFARGAFPYQDYVIARRPA